MNWFYAIIIGFYIIKTLIIMIKFSLYALLFFVSTSLFAQDKTDALHVKLTDTIHFKDGSYELLAKDDPDLENKIAEILYCDDKVGKCKFNGKYLDRVVVKVDHGKKRKGNKGFKPDIQVFTPLDFSKAFVKPIKRAEIFTLPKLIYQGENYDYYEGTLIAVEHKDFAILTKSNSKEVEAIITTRSYINGLKFNYKYLLSNSVKCLAIQKQLKVL